MSESAAILASQTGWGLLALMSVLWVVLGFYWGRNGKTLDGHMLASRNVGLALGAATCVATWITSNTTMLAPQFALQMGIWGMLAYSTAAIGLFLFAPLASRIRELMPNGYTSAEFIRHRFGKKAWYTFLIISFFYAFTWLISMGIAGGLLLEALSGIPYQWGMTAIIFVCTLYTVVGGMRAVIGTDFIQTAIILVGIVIIAIAVLNEVSLQQVYAQVKSESPALLNVLLPVALMALFNNLLFGIGEIFHSNVWWSRAFAMRGGVGKHAYLIAGCLWLPVPITAGFIALAASLIGVNIPHVNMVGPLVVSKLLGTMGAVMIFIVVFASIASSIDSLLAATSDLITKEIFGAIVYKTASDEKLRRTTIWVTGSLGFATWLVCCLEDADLGTVLFRAGPLVGSTIWPIITGLYWKNTNPMGAVAAMVLGSFCGIVAYYGIGWYSAALVGTAVSMLVIITWSKLDPKPFDWGKLKAE